MGVATPPEREPKMEGDNTRFLGMENMTRVRCIMELVYYCR